MSAAAAEPFDVVEADVVIDEPGVYDIPEDQYHADPVAEGSLSHSGAKSLLPPSCPAIFRWQRDHVRPDTRAFDFGHAAHKLVLGVGAEIVGVDAADWRTKAAKQQAADIRDEGGVPLLTRELADVEQMAAALREHPITARLLAPGAGTPEASLFWIDVESGIWLRARMDWLPCATDRRMIVTDYKTTVTANPRDFGKSAANFGYYIQHAWYTQAVRALGLAEDVAFVFVVQEKTPPYLISVVELDAEAVRLGERQMRRAIDIYQECTANGQWPGYSDDVELVALPYWFTKTLDEEDE